MSARSFQKLRKFPRITVKALVKIKGDFSDFPFYMSKNLSEGGIFLVAKTPQPQGTRVLLEFTLPDSSGPITAGGEIVSCLPYDPDKKDEVLYGMGVKFTNIHDKHRVAIRDFVEKNLTSKPRTSP